MIRFLVVALVLLASVPASAQSVSTCDPDSRQASGSIYRLCLPPAAIYNNRLVVWAHGFQDAGTPVGIPEDQLCINGVCLPALINSLGFGFATNSYSKTGLAVLQGKDDLLDLVQIYTARHGKPDKVYLVGASEGGIITALSLEQRPDVYAAGVAACGPIGDFVLQINYFGDARATFQYFFPGLIPGDPFNPSPAFVSGWESYYQSVVRPAIFAPANLSRLQEWAAVAQLPSDPANWPTTIEKSAHDALRYSVVNLNDAAVVLGGFPFGNRSRWYTGSSNDVLLNAFVPRVDASPAAISAMNASYATSGYLQHPLITIHTLQDQQVPYWHEYIYFFKTAASGALLARHLPVAVDRYGHCNFTTEELLWSFFAMLVYDGAVNKSSLAATGLDAGQQAAIHEQVRATLAPFRDAQRLAPRPQERADP